MSVFFAKRQLGLNPITSSVKMATGDVKNNLRKLQSELRAVKYERDLDYDSLSKGLPTSFLAIYDYAFNNYSPRITQQITDASLELVGKSDLRFIEAMYKVLRELYDYKPSITTTQYFQNGFGERKIIMCTEIISKLRKRNRELGPKSAPAKPKKPVTAHGGIKVVTKSKENTQPMKCGTSEMKKQLKKPASTKIDPAQPDAVKEINPPSLNKSLSPTNNPAYQVLRHAQAIPDLVSQSGSSIVCDSQSQDIVSSSDKLAVHFSEAVFESTPMQDIQSAACATGHMMSNNQSVEIVSLPTGIQPLDSGPTTAEPVRPIDMISQTPAKPPPARLTSAQGQMKVGDIGAQLHTIQQTMQHLVDKLTGLEDRMSVLEVQLDGDMDVPLRAAKNVDGQEKLNAKHLENLMARMTLLENKTCLMENNMGPVSPPVPPVTTSNSVKSFETVNSEAPSKSASINAAFLTERSSTDFEKHDEENDTASMFGKKGSEFTTSTPATQVNKIQEMMMETERLLNMNTSPVVMTPPASVQ